MARVSSCCASSHAAWSKSESSGFLILRGVKLATHTCRVPLVTAPAAGAHAPRRARLLVRAALAVAARAPTPGGGGGVGSAGDGVGARLEEILHALGVPSAAREAALARARGAHAVGRAGGGGGRRGGGLDAVATTGAPPAGKARLAAPSAAHAARCAALLAPPGDDEE